MHTRRTPTLPWLVCIGVLFFACGSPETGTPMPEPLSLDPSRILAPDLVAQPATFPAPLTFLGGADAAPHSVQLRVTNLDSTDPPVVTTTRADGGFVLSISASIGDELRFQAIVGGPECECAAGARRLAPVDVRIGASDRLDPVLRPSCVELIPPAELDFGAVASSRELDVGSSCAGPISVTALDTRLGLPDFTTTAPVPIEVAPGERAVVAVSFAPAADGEREDVLFVRVTVAGQAVRYPLTLTTGAR